MKPTLATLLLFVAACSSGNKLNTPETLKKGTFGYDLAFLRQYDDSLTVLRSAGSSAQVIVSAKYQGKVFTSTAEGPGGAGFGWINEQAFGPKPAPHMNAYGGENRLWLGPEGAQFSLFFKPGATMDFTNWQTPPAFDTEPWRVTDQNTQSISLEKTTTLTNYAGTVLPLRIDRTVALLNRETIGKRLGISIDDGLHVVGYQTTNRLTNTGKTAWTRQTGAPCMWLLDMLTPAPHVTIVLPYETATTGPVATTDYFGAIPPDRIADKNGALFFRADGKSRGKLGLGPQRAKPIAGSYDPDRQILTLVLFDVDKTGTYLNQAWKLVANPFQGDAVNAYNDGPLADGTQMGPFYELESVSPAAFLQPGASLDHRHAVVHLTGDKTQLDAVAKKSLGVSLAQIQAAFAR